MTVNDGGIMHTSSFCNGLWNTTQASRLRHRILRRTPMEVALYVRVSTSRQQQQQTIEQQLSRLRDHVATHPDWHVAEEHIYRDDGYSGATLKRPGLDRLRDRAALAAVEGVVITAPDRLARNYVHQMLLVDELTQRGCRVEFVDRPMDDNPHDQLLLQIRGAVAEYERTLIAERMRRGRQAKLRSGQLLPWTRAPYGYLLDPERPRDPSRVRLAPVQAAVVEHMFAWYTDASQAPSLYQVAKRLSDAQIPTPRGGKRWNVASVRGILRSPTYMGVAYSGRTRPAPARRRKSALQPVGSGQSQQPAPAEEWIAVPVPAIISEETFEAAQHRLDRNVQMARRNNTTYTYLLRGLVSCGQCRLTCGGRTLHPGYHYYFCRGRTDALRLALGERCTARYAPAHALDTLVWQDLCRVLREPALITHELERAQRGAWLPQALQARRQTLRDVLAQLERQQARLLDVYLAEVIEREEFARRRKEVAQTQHGLTQQLRQLDAQAQQQVNVAALAQGIEAFGQRMQPTLDKLTFAQRRQLVELLIDRVIVNDTQVEIRYVVPTGPNGETTPFCHLRLDYPASNGTENRHSDSEHPHGETGDHRHDHRRV
jgi:site-specific DNA recombinase